MASCQTARWVSTAPYVVLTVTQTESTDTAVTLSWTLQYKSDYAANTNGAGRAYTVKIGGSVVKEGTYNIDGITGTKTIASGTKTINKTTAAQSIAFSVSFNFSLTWSGTYGGTKSASSSISIGAKTSYTVTYNANGGSGAPATQTKWHGTNLTLSSTKPTKTGYAFQGWALSKADADAGTWYYQPGSTCGQNNNLTLYAVWEANTYKVTYNANGGSGAPAAQTKTYGKALTLSSTKPTRTNYTFKGWGTSASATKVTYAAGASYTANAAITLYAVWELAYEKPRITLGTIGRCTSDGTASDTGPYAKVNFDWACDKTVSSIKIEWKLASTTTWTNSKSVSATGTSGTVGIVIGDGALSVEKTYAIRITVSDSGGSFSRTAPINGIKFAFDALPNNEGVAFGKPAENKQYADFAYKVRLRDNMLLQADKAIYSRNAEDTESLALLYLTGTGNTSLGYGGYTKKIGNTNIYGQNITLNVDDGVFIKGKRLSGNKVLWSGALYMSEGQTATLSEAVSLQANGIILVFSEYTDGAAVNANFNMQFIPRYFVSAFESKGVNVVISSATMNAIANKYVYISDTSITGYATNNTAATEVSSGVVRTSKNFVLRAVIGV